MANGKYHEWLKNDNLILLEAWARNGLTDEQIAHNMGITTSTLYDWKNKYSEISESLKRGKEVIDILVENALLKRALGYKYTETKKIESKKDGLRTEVTIKEVVPDTTAQIFWLKNRKLQEWRDKREVTNKVKENNNGIIKHGDAYILRPIP